MCWTGGKSNKFFSASSMSREVPDRLPSNAGLSLAGLEKEAGLRLD